MEDAVGKVSVARISSVEPARDVAHGEAEDAVEPPIDLGHPGLELVPERRRRRGGRRAAAE